MLGLWGWESGIVLGVGDWVELWGRDGGYFGGGGDFDEFGVAVPFSAAGVAAPAVLSPATISPLFLC